METERLQVQRWPIGRLLPYAANARTHSPAQVAQIATSIARFGFNVPCTVNGQGVLIAGHGRLLAAQSLGMQEVPVIVLDDLSETQVRAYRLADNQIALNASWDQDLLAAEVAALRDLNFDLPVLGFADRELDEMLRAVDQPAAAAGRDEDALPEVPTTAVTRRGDLWQLGRHRLLCGDATAAADVQRLLDGAVPVLMVTDPPYGVNYDPMWRARARPQQPRGTVPNDDRADWSDAWRLFPGGVAYVWHASLQMPAVWASLVAAGFEIRNAIIWVKSRMALSRGDYHWQHEPCFYAVRRGARSNWQGDRTQTTCWMIAPHSDYGDLFHGTQKVVECMRRPIVNNTARGEAVYDPFVGSGTTLIAAEDTGRVCYAMDIDERYCDLAIVRWQQWTGEAARLVDGGQTLAELQLAREVRVPAPPPAARISRRSGTPARRAKR
jgi:DNA modification methylase